jgi:tetratricopeptide (TPR) repeat protein
MTGRVQMKRFLAMLALLILSAIAYALPSVEAVQKEVQQGNYAQAETMMREVVAARPNSAKAHYVYAEVLAHNGRFDQAAQEARLAKQIDPQLGFTQPEKFRAFEQLLEREQSRAKALPATPPATRAPATVAPATAAPVGRSSSGLPGWVWGLGFAAVAVLVWRLVSARRQASAMAGGPGYMAPAGASPGYGPAYGPMAGPASAGSGMLGTGLAAAGGFAAGMLAEKMLDGRHEHDTRDTSGAGSAAAGGLVPGMFDDAAARDPAAEELEQRSIDFGSGGDWGGGDGAGGGGSDDGGW